MPGVSETNRDESPKNQESEPIQEDSEARPRESGKILVEAAKTPKDSDISGESVTETKASAANQVTLTINQETSATNHERSKTDQPSAANKQDNLSKNQEKSGKKQKNKEETLIEIEKNIKNSKMERNFADIVDATRHVFNSGKTKKIEFREMQLKNMLRMCDEHLDDLLEAFKEDMRKPKQESIVVEIELLKNEIKYLLKHLKNFVKPYRPPKRIINFFDQIMIYNDPYGVVLVIGTWNYPIHLTLMPVAGAIAAGNCVVIKPSEIAKSTANFMAKVLPK